MYFPVIGRHTSTFLSLRWNHIFLTGLLLQLFPINEAVAGFCWDTDNSGYCEVQSRYGQDYREDHNFGNLNTTSKQSLDSAPFRFRSDCHTSYYGCGGQDWELSLIQVSHTVDGQDQKSRYKLELQLKPFGWVSKNWKVHNKPIKGNDNDLYSMGMSGAMRLRLNFTKRQMEKLPSGTHRFTVVIRGGDTDGAEVYRDFHYPFVFTIGDQVKISGLEPVDLGLFPNHKNEASQSLCVYVTGGGDFSIKATSENGGSDYTLSSNGETIHYKAFFAMNNNRSGLFELTEIPRSKDNSGHFLQGSSSVDCIGDGAGENMWLKVQLDESFQMLSRKKAGTYTDTLTLTVAAE